MPPQSITNAERAYRAIAPCFQGADREQAVVLGVNRRLKPIGVHLVSMGCLDYNVVHPREVCKVLILMNAFAWILAHNHPSAHLCPSREDHALTRLLVAASDTLSIPLLDHLIVGPDGRYCSLFERKMRRGQPQRALRVAEAYHPEYPSRRSPA